MQPFSKYDLNGLIAERNVMIKKELLSLDDDTVLANDIEVIVEKYFEKHKYLLVDIFGEDQTKRKVLPVTIKIPNSFHNQGKFGPAFFEAKGYRLTSTFNYSGDQILFECNYGLISLGLYPEIVLSDASFEISTEERSEKVENDDGYLLANNINKDLDIIKKFLEQSNCGADKFNSGLKRFIREIIQNRIVEIKKYRKIKELYNIPIYSSNPDIIKIIKVDRKVFPLVKAKGEEEEYCISNATYEDILKIIKHHCSTFERTPHTYLKHDEEELRDIILAALNSIFRGNANGEAFRKKGKTDISIEFNNRAAFVAELKFWDGEKVFREAIEQLFNYTTWRDNKLCLIIFSKNKNFFEVVSKIESYLSNNEFKLSLSRKDKNEFEYICRSPRNTGQQISVRVFSVDLYRC